MKTPFFLSLLAFGLLCGLALAPVVALDLDEEEAGAMEIAGESAGNEASADEEAAPAGEEASENGEEAAPEPVLPAEIAEVVAISAPVEDEEAAVTDEPAPAAVNDLIYGGGEEDELAADLPPVPAAPGQLKKQDSGQDGFGPEKAEKAREKAAEKSADKNKTGLERAIAETHRSAVANAVLNILSAAGREPNGIGEQVRKIAAEHALAGDKAATAMEKVQNRSKARTFFFGTDYKNTGALRSEMVKSKNRINRLAQMAAAIEDEENKAAVLAEIKVLETEQARINEFIKENESRFSIFGWFLKTFR